MNDSATTTVQNIAGGSDGDREERYAGPWWRFPPLRNALISGGFLTLGYVTALFGLLPEPVSIALFLVAALFGASKWGVEAIENVMHFHISIDVLMGVATLGAAALGLWEEVAFLAFLYGAAEGLEEFTYDRTRHAIRALLDLAPKEAHVLRDGRETVIPASGLRLGDIFVVRPGESLPTDGVIRTGTTSLNEAPVTGESVPVEKAPGAAVFAGTVNLTGAIEVETTRDFADNSLSRIIHLVEEAQEEKTHAQRLIDRFGDRYSPAILLGVVFLLVVPPLLGADFREWAERAITLAVAGAPCALVMSTPVAVATAIGAAGKRGVLIKGGVHLENLGTIKALAFDKTGTLTVGKPVVTDIVPIGTSNQDEVLGLAATVETYSRHPLAMAIVSRAQASGGATVSAARDAEALVGAGAKARIGDREIYAGSVELFGSLGVDVTIAEGIASDLAAQGKSVVLVGSNKEVFGILALQDELRPGAREALAALRRAGIQRLVMLTGDNRRTAAAIAEQAGIDEAIAELKPEQKNQAIQRLQREVGPTAMVGDGINDAPALAIATVGIAMGTIGTDAAIEAADVALMGDDLGSVAYAIELGRRARGISRQNIVFSIALLVVLVPLAVLGLISVAVAVVAHEVAELIAVANGLRSSQVKVNRDVQT